MNRFIQQDTRTETLYHHVRAYVRRTSEDTYAQMVVEKYHELVPAELRVVEFKTEGDAAKCMRINSQKLFRYFDEDINARLPVDLEEALVLALPEPFQSACLADLSARYGLLAARIPEGVAGHADIAILLKETSDVMNVLGQMYEDGVMDANDAKHKATAIKEINDAIAALVTLRGRIEKEVVEDEPKLKAVK